jgi:hypothetical protein
MRGRLPSLLFVVLAATSAHAAAAACEAREIERAGVRFLSVCPAGFSLSAAPVTCAAGEAPCEPVTPLEASAFASPAKNHSVEALLTDAASAARICAQRYGGRLPTPLEREAARLAFGLASLRVREEPGEFERLRLHAQPEWVSENGHASHYPSVATPPLPGGDVLLACVAEPAMPRAHAVPIGESCLQRPVEAGVRSPDCAVVVPGTHARFELGCDPERTVRSHARADAAAFRCLLPAPAERASR